MNFVVLESTAVLMGQLKMALENLSNISHMPTKFDAGTLSSQHQLFKNTVDVFSFESMRADRVLKMLFESSPGDL